MHQMGFGVKSSLLLTAKFHTQVQIAAFCVSSLADNYCLEWIIIYLCLLFLPSASRSRKTPQERYCALFKDIKNIWCLCWKARGCNAVKCCFPFSLSLTLTLLHHWTAPARLSSITDTVWSTVHLDAKWNPSLWWALLKCFQFMIQNSLSWVKLNHCFWKCCFVEFSQFKITLIWFIKNKNHITTWWCQNLKYVQESCMRWFLTTPSMAPTDQLGVISRPHFSIAVDLMAIAWPHGWTTAQHCHQVTPPTPFPRATPTHPPPVVLPPIPSHPWHVSCYWRSSRLA